MRTMLTVLRSVAATRSGDFMHIAIMVGTEVIQVHRKRSMAARQRTTVNWGSRTSLPQPASATSVTHSAFMW